MLHLHALCLRSLCNKWPPRALLPPPTPTPAICAMSSGDAPWASFRATYAFRSHGAALGRDAIRRRRTGTGHCRCRHHRNHHRRRRRHHHHHLYNDHHDHHDHDDDHSHPHIIITIIIGEYHSSDS